MKSFSVSIGDKQPNTPPPKYHTTAVETLLAEPIESWPLGEALQLLVAAVRELARK